MSDQYRKSPKGKEKEKERRSLQKSQERQMKIQEAQEKGTPLRIRWVCEYCGSYAMTQLRYLEEDKRVLCQGCLKYEKKVGKEKLKEELEKVKEELLKRVRDMK